LEAGHRAGGGGGGVLGPAAAQHGSHSGIDTEALGVVHVLVAGQPAIDRLAEEGPQAVLGVLPDAGVMQSTRRRVGQAQRVVEFAVGQESSVAGDRGAVEHQFDLAVEVHAQGVLVAVTHWVPRSFRQEVVGNAGFSGEKAQTPCRNDRIIWEMWANSSVRVTTRRPRRLPSTSCSSSGLMISRSPRS